MQTAHARKAASYDQVQVENYSFPQSHPDRLATVGKLFGLTAPDITKAKVLELGCAAGGNLVPLAEAYPGGTFVGIDLSARQIADAQSMTSTLSLKNISFKHMDLLDVNDAFGKFDYIIVRGVFSLVSKAVQEKILDICEKNLEANGVAYIDYNTYPGWHQRGMIRDMMLYHTAQFTGPGPKALQARALLDFLSTAVAGSSAYGLLLKNELELLKQQKDSYLLHDLLEDDNEPVYFHQFVERAAAHNLQYLGEAEFSAMVTGNLAPQVAETVQRISNDIIRTEQYMDFVRNRSFRQTLLCHKGVQLNRNLEWEQMRSFRFATLVSTEADQAELLTENPTIFLLPSGVTMTVGQPVVKIAIDYLSRKWPQSATLEELLQTVRERTNSGTDDKALSAQQEQMLATDLLTGYAAGVMAARLNEPQMVSSVSKQPAVSRLAIHQAKTGQRITSQLHESVDVDIFVRHLITLLDGTRDVPAVLVELEKFVKRGSFNVSRDGRQLTGGDELRRVLAAMAEESMQKMARSGLFIA